jgi:CoA-transferase family III
MMSLHDAIRDTSARFAAASRTLGRTVLVDPVEMLERDVAPGLSPPGHWSPNRHCQLIAAQDGWLAVSLARDDDVRTVPAWTGSALEAEPWRAVAEYLSATRCDIALENAIQLHLPVARVGETELGVRAQPRARTRRTGKSLEAIDLSALWAGPFCGALLAQAGIAVTRIENPDRPDPTAFSTPLLHQHLNSKKQVRSLRLDDPRLIEAIASTDIIITSGRPHALARSGLTEERLFAINPSLLWVAITAHGWRDDAALRVGFGDDCAAAGGLIEWCKGAPHFMGDALADPLTGLEAALTVALAIDREAAGLIDISLAETAARYASHIGLR